MEKNIENQKIINKFNTLKSKYEYGIRLKDEKSYQSLMNELILLESSFNNKIIKNFLIDIKTTKEGTLTLKKTIESINNSNNENFITSIFNIPYEPTMGIDACFYELINIEPALKKYKTNAVPILLKEKTKGFDAPHMVAIFPENHEGIIASKGDKIFYLVNKFAIRHLNTTQKIIQSCVDTNSLKRLRNITYQDMEDAVVYWVYLHEHHHQNVGNLPIPEYLNLKSSKLLAGLEELRVDIGSMLLLYEGHNKFIKNNIFLFEFILSERLLRYGVDGLKYNRNNKIAPSYDALSSYMFFNLLEKKDGIKIKNNKIIINEKIIYTLKEIYKEINETELKIKKSNTEDRKKIMLEFAKKCLGDEKPESYISHPFYNKIREKINHQI